MACFISPLFQGGLALCARQLRHHMCDFMYRLVQISPDGDDLISVNNLKYNSNRFVKRTVRRDICRGFLWLNRG